MRSSKRPQRSKDLSKGHRSELGSVESQSGYCRWGIAIGVCGFGSNGEGMGGSGIKLGWFRCYRYC